MAATILLVTQQQKDEMAARVRALMDAQGLNNPRLARKAAISEKTVSRLLNARMDPRYDTLDRVASALGVTEADLRGAPVAPLGLNVADGPDPLERRLDELLGLVRGIDQSVRLLLGSATVDATEEQRQTEASATPTRQTRRRRPR